MSEIAPLVPSGGAGRVMIVEDDRMVVLDLESMLQSFGFELCPSAHSAEEAMQIARTHTPEVVLMDIRLEGDVDGIAAAEMLRDELGLRVIYLTAHSDLSTVGRAKRTHPYAYLLKPVRSLDLRCCLELAIHEARYSRISYVDPPEPSATPEEQKQEGAALLSGLSAREIEVLTLIARGHTSKSIAQALNIAKPTVDTYRSRLSEKLGVRSRSELVTIAARAGLV